MINVDDPVIITLDFLSVTVCRNVARVFDTADPPQLSAGQFNCHG